MKIDYWQIFEEGHYYHIYNHAAGSRNIFTTDLDYQDFLIKHDKYLSCVFDTIAFCLMPNHFHFIFKVKSTDVVLENIKNVNTKTSRLLKNEETDVNNFIIDQYRRFMSSYALTFNHRNGNRGQLFLKRFKRIALDSEDRLPYMICYVHHNPIHHGFASAYRSWKYSSFLNYTGNNQKVPEIFKNQKDFLETHKFFKIDQNEKRNID